MSESLLGKDSPPSQFEKSELLFRRLLEKLPAGAYTCDAEGLITYYNPRAVDLWGRAPKLNEPEDRFCGSFRLFAVDGSPIRHDQCWMALALQNSHEYNGHEIVIERPDGKRLTVLAHANPIYDDSLRVCGAVNVLVDITERKRSEQILQEADRAKDEFIATLAHELRNPLAPIRNAVQILNLSGQASTELQWAVKIIDRQIDQMTRLIDDLLDVSRISRNTIELRKEPIDLASVVQSAVETSRPLIDSAAHEFTVTFPPGATYVEADPTRLGQAISNLVNNAARYTPRGGRISIAVERREGQVVVSVRDNGIGIPQDMLDRIFDLFTQVDRSLERAQGGLGIGLTLARRLIELHGGSIHAHSDGPGTGSEFQLRLPLCFPSSREVSGSQPARNLPASSLRILVVDDNRDSASTLAALLRSMGNEIAIAYDGEEALQAACGFRPDVALLDLGLPRRNGFDLAREIRRQSWASNAVLIAVTGWGQETDKDRSREAGFDYHLVKPVDPAALMELVASIEQQRKGVA